jgi:1-acyl-sn-glycerol-3-phosphate acyltransferase
MSKEYKFYRFVYRLLLLPFYIIFGMKITGRENIPKGSAMVCSPHSSFLDPIFVAYGMGIDNHVHFMAKKELFSNKLLSKIIYLLGSFSVDRSTNDVGAIKNAMMFLKHGEKVGIFPEGTRVAQDDAVAAKSGAVKIADKTNVPVVPVYLQRKKRAFGRVHIVVGQPYYVNPERIKLTNEQYQEKADELMQKIKRLGQNV